MRTDDKTLQFDTSKLLGFDQVSAVGRAVRLGAKVGVAKGGAA